MRYKWFNDEIAQFAFRFANLQRWMENSHYGNQSKQNVTSFPKGFEKCERRCLKLGCNKSGNIIRAAYTKVSSKFYWQLFSQNVYLLIFIHSFFDPLFGTREVRVDFDESEFSTSFDQLIRLDDQRL